MAEEPETGVLDKLEAKHEIVDDDGPVLKPVESPDGGDKPVKKDSDAQVKEKTTSKDKTSEEDKAAFKKQADDFEDDGDEPKLDSAEVGKARRYLELKSIPHEGLSEEHLLSLRTAVARREAETDRAFTERAEFKKRVEELEAATGVGVSANGKPAASLDFEEVTKDFTEQFGEDATKALLSALKPLQSQLEHQEKSISQQRESETVRMLDVQRARLGERYPRLKESDDAWRAVVLDARGRITDATDEQNFDGLFNDSVHAIYGEPPRKRRTSSHESKERDNGQPSPGQRQPANETLSKDEIGSRILDELEEKHGITED